MVGRRTDSGATTGYEAELWAMAEALRGSVDAGEDRDEYIAPGYGGRGP